MCSIPGAPANGGGTATGGMPCSIGGAEIKGGGMPIKGGGIGIGIGIPGCMPKGGGAKPGVCACA